MSVKVMSMVYAAHFHDITFIHKGKKKTTGEEYEKAIRVLNSNLKSVCLALADHANDEGEGTYPSIETLESKTELSNKTVIHCLKAMKQEEIISYVGRSKWNTGNYTVNKAKIAEMETWERQKRESVATTLSKVKPVHKESVATTHKPSIHPKPSINEDEDAKAIEDRTKTIKELYEQNIGASTPLLMSMFRNAAITYPADWYQPAFEATVKSAKHRSWSFTEAVLQGWKDHGFGWKPGKSEGNGANHANRKSNSQPGGKPVVEEFDPQLAELGKQILAERRARQHASV